jgi:site-specific DNA-methyltransferase (adenine-specific)
MSTHTLQLGDCREILQTLPEQSVHCCVTSPPYFGLRDYGMAEQIGLEPTPEQFVAELVAVFREVRRVLRDDGTLWLNLGDSYASSGVSGKQASTSKLGKGCDGSIRRAGGQPGPNPKMMDQVFGRAPTPEGLKTKDLIGIPWRVAFALQSDGWYLRQDIIWHKPNPMPESVTDRCTKAHEYVFLLSKSARYYYNADSIKIQATDPETMAGIQRPSIEPLYLETGNKGAGRYRCNLHNQAPREMVNRRSVWTIATQPYKGAHFATFPPALVEPCILAGCPVGGTVLDPFSGSATTGQVALANARNYIGCELNPEYHELAQRRLDGAQLGLPLTTP